MDPLSHSRYTITQKPPLATTRKKETHKNKSSSTQISSSKMKHRLRAAAHHATISVCPEYCGGVLRQETV